LEFWGFKAIDLNNIGHKGAAVAAWGDGGSYRPEGLSWLDADLDIGSRYCRIGRTCGRASDGSEAREKQYGEERFTGVFSLL